AVTLRRPPRRSARARAARAGAESNARTSTAVNRHKPRAVFAVLQPDGDARRRQHASAGFRPFDEDDRFVEVRLEVPPLRGRHATEAEEVEMRDVDAAVVAVADRERRARDRLGHTERATRSAHEGRLPRAEVARDGHHVTQLERPRELRCQLLRFLRRVTLRQKRPSWTAGSAATAVRNTGSGGGATSRPSNSGMRAKSDFSTSSMRGVYRAAAG